jgi:hypothetical protein
MSVGLLSQCLPFAEPHQNLQSWVPLHAATVQFAVDCTVSARFALQFVPVLAKAQWATVSSKHFANSWLFEFATIDKHFAFLVPVK